MPAEKIDREQYNEHASTHSELFLVISDLRKRIQVLENNHNKSRSTLDNRDNNNRPFVVANPSPLGLFGVAIVTWLSGLMKIHGTTTRSEFLSATGIFIGGIAQVIAGGVCFLRNNTHSATTFSLYGLHWISTGWRLLRNEGAALRSSIAGGISHDGVMYYSLLAFTTFILFIPTLLMNYVLASTLLLVTVLYIFDAVSEYTGSRTPEIIAGYLSCAAATGAFYLVTADLVNESWRKVILPIFPHRVHRDDYYYKTHYVPKNHHHKSVTAAAHM